MRRHRLVRAATDGRGVSAVIDPGSGAMTEVTLDRLAFEGRLVAIGTAASSSTVYPARLMARNAAVVGLSWGSTYPWQAPEQVATVYRSLFDLLDGS